MTVADLRIKSRDACESVRAAFISARILRATGSDRRLCGTAQAGRLRYKL